MSSEVRDTFANETYSLEFFFESSADLLCIAGFDGYFKRISPSVSRLLGYSHAELMARPIYEFIHPEDRPLTARHRDNISNNVPLLNFENRYITKSGETIWLSWTSMPVEELKLVYAIAKNITHKKKLEHERNALIANLTRVNDELKLATLTTSHDLRSPVSNLLAIFSLMDVSKIQDEKTLEFIEILKMAAESLKQTLSNYEHVLNQNDDLGPAIEKVYFDACLSTVMQSLNSLVRDSKATIAADFAAVEHILFNKPYLESIFLNLVTNSIKYARPGVPPQIKIYSRKSEGVSELVFSDDGQGFDMEQIKDKLFGFRQKFHHHADSKGIGLYLVYHHVTSLGGSIAIDSKPNEGATFVISFKA